MRGKRYIGICEWPDCSSSTEEGRPFTRRMCPRHYQQWKREGGLGVKCIIDDCERFADTRGLCGTHLARERAAGGGGVDPCSIDWCDRGGTQNGLCGAHYYRLQNGLDMDAPFRKAGEWQPWYETSKGYVQRRKSMPDGGRVWQWQHRFVMEEYLGRDLLPEENVHHLNGDRADNRIENLEIWNTSQPCGQRPEDKVEYALEILSLYAPHRLAE